MQGRALCGQCIPERHQDLQGSQVQGLKLIATYQDIPPLLHQLNRYTMQVGGMQRSNLTRQS